MTIRHKKLPFSVRRASPGGEAKYELVVHDPEAISKACAVRGDRISGDRIYSIGISAAWVDYSPADDREPDEINIVYGWHHSPERDIEAAIFYAFRDAALPLFRKLHNSKE